MPAGPPSSAPMPGAPWAAPGAGGPSGPAGPPVTPGPPPSNGRRKPALIAAAVLAVLALIVGTLVFVMSNGKDESDTAATSTTSAPDESDRSTTTTAPADPDPTTTVDAAPVVPDAEFLAMVKELQAYVATARGLVFTRDVTVELQDDAEFEAGLLEDFEEDREDIESTEVFFKALGLIAPDVSLVDVLKDIYAAGVLGYYDPETDELVVRGASASPYVRQTIVHELVHALDDQQFELDRPEYDDRDDEIGTGFSAVVEGNARRVEDAWLAAQPADVRDKAAEEEAAFGDGIDFESFPEILLFQIGAPYDLGEIFVGQLLREGGERAVDAAIVTPPDTSEQFLFPDRFTTRDPRIEVPAPPVDGELFEDGVVGALFLFGLFTTGENPINEQDAVRAIEGWGGDWAVTWQSEEANCIRADFVGDTDSDTNELESALEAWSELNEIGDVSRVDGRVRLESCVATADPTPPQV